MSKEKLRIFSERLRTAREAKNKSQTDLAQMLGVQPGSIGNWEIGGNFAGPENLIKLSDILEVSIDYLLGQNEKKQPENGMIQGMDGDLKEKLRRAEIIERHLSPMYAELFGKLNSSSEPQIPNRVSASSLPSEAALTQDKSDKHEPPKKRL